MTGAPGFDKVWAGPLDLAPLDLSGGLDAAQTLWRATLAEELYGRMPPPPEAVSVTRHSLPDAHAERLELTIKARGGQVTVDAALWLPDGANSDTPLICGLDFTGPLGVLTSDAFPLDSAARAFTRPELGAPEGRLTEVLRGTAGHRWPVDLMLARGYGVMVSCYGSWVPDDPLLWVAHGLQPLLGDPEAGAIGALLELRRQGNGQKQDDHAQSDQDHTGRRPGPPSHTADARKQDKQSHDRKKIYPGCVEPAASVWSPGNERRQDGQNAAQ